MGNVAFTSNPRVDASLATAAVSNMMTRVWSRADDVFPDSLQEWSETDGAAGMKVLNLDVNHRSGNDVWYRVRLSTSAGAVLSIWTIGGSSTVLQRVAAAAG